MQENPRQIGRSKKSHVQIRMNPLLSPDKLNRHLQALLRNSCKPLTRSILGLKPRSYLALFMSA